MGRSPSDAAAPLDGGLLSRLAGADLVPEGVLAAASNHTVLVRVGGQGPELRAIYKPRAGERPLRDFPPGTLYQREAAAYAVSESLGWGIVPPTVVRDGPMGVGSAQLFVPHDPQRHYFSLLEDPAHHAALARLAVFDLLVNNADRKASHVLLADDGRILGCDHGLTFHPEPKLRTVIWDLGGAPVERSWHADLGRLGLALAAPDDPLTARLTHLLASPEIDVLRLRADVLRQLEVLPDIDVRERGYPWPLL